jgi:hypothetical protein
MHYMAYTPFLGKAIQGRTSTNSQNYKVWCYLTEKKNARTHVLTLYACYSAISVKVITREDPLIKKLKWYWFVVIM